MTKIPVRVTAYFWLLAALIGWLNSESLLGTSLWIVVIFVSVLVHEYGHALTALLFGQRAEIELVGMGGVTHRSGPNLKLWKEFLIVLNGPLAGFCLFLIAGFLQATLKPSPASILGYILNITVFANLFWTVLNLLPIYPLDGGHLLKIILEGLFGLNGVKIALLLSVAIGTLLAIGFFILHYYLTGAILFMLTFESWRAWQQVSELSSSDQSEPLQNKLKEAGEAYQMGRESEAIALLENIQQEAPRGLIYYSATQLLGQIFAKRGELKKAYDQLKGIQSKLSKESLVLLQQLSYREGDFDRAIDIGNQLFRESPSFEVALVNAFSHAAKVEAQPTVAWLQSAVKNGLPNPGAILNKPEFNAVRQNEAFRELAARYG